MTSTELKVALSKANTAKVADMRTAVNSLLEEKFSQTNGCIAPSDIGSDEAETLGFVCKEHADAIKECCKKHRVTVTFRAAGANSITKIKAGHPCKGHDILDKSIKKIGTDWTYTADGINLEDYAGLIGHTKEKSPKKQLDMIHYFDGEKSNTTEPQNITADNILSCYTGDYDMHDLYYKGNRLVADTLDESSTIDYLNNAITAKDTKRINNYKKYINANNRTFNSPYALIRHGAQMMYIDYMLSTGQKAELKSALKCNSFNMQQLLMGNCVAKIDDNLIAFTSDGNIFHINSLYAVYQFYKKYNILKHVPFYNFFELLKKNEQIGKHKITDVQALIAIYSEKINELLKFHVGLPIQE